MKRFLPILATVLFLFLSNNSSAQQTDMSPMIQPHCAYHTSLAQFTGQDSSFRTKLANNALVNGYWLRVRRSPGLDSAVVWVGLSRNTLDTTFRYPIYFQNIDLGVERAYLFNKIYRSGTTAGVIDSLLDWGPKLNLDNYKW